MKNLENRADIEHLVRSFYTKVVKDELIGHFFTEIIKVDWDLHLPKMFDFWETILFGKMSYKGNPMQKHFPINELMAMEQQHFDRWLSIWKETVVASFEGENADAAVSKSQNIANLMAYKMQMARK